MHQNVCDQSSSIRILYVFHFLKNTYVFSNVFYFSIRRHQ